MTQDNLNENLRKEFATQSEYPIIKGLEDTPTVLETFARETLDIIIEDDAPILIPLNGSILPLYYILAILNENQNDLDLIINRLVFVQDEKIDDEEINFLHQSKPIKHDGRVIVIDDIADTLGLAQKIQQTLGVNQIDIYTPVTKTHTDGIKNKLDFQCNIHAAQTVVDGEIWIASSCGMNEGANTGSTDQRALLATLQRLAKVGVALNEKNHMTIEEKIDFFREIMPPDFTEQDNLFQLALQLETAKINKNFEEMMQLANNIIPFIRQKINDLGQIN